MFGLSSRTGQRKEPTWTQAPSDRTSVEPVWRDVTTDSPAYEPSRQQAGQERPRRSSARLWISAVVGVIGLLAVVILILILVNVVQEQVARNQPSASGVQPHTGAALISSPVSR